MLGLVDSNQFTPSLPLTPRSVSNLTSGREHAIAQGNNWARSTTRIDVRKYLGTDSGSNGSTAVFIWPEHGAIRFGSIFNAASGSSRAFDSQLDDCWQGQFLRYG
jgi:hypothetical protein